MAKDVQPNRGCLTQGDACFGQRERQGEPITEHNSLYCCGRAADGPGDTFTDNTNVFVDPGTGESINKKLCLTDEGLIYWQQILGSATYQTWLNTHGSNTTLYGCSEIIELENIQETVNEPLYTTDCDYNIYSRAEAVEQIEYYKKLIKELESENESITKEVEFLESQTTTITNEASCTSYVDLFENFSISFAIEVNSQPVYQENIFNIGEGNLWEYIKSSSGATGIIIGDQNTTLNNLCDEQTNEKTACNKYLLKVLANEIYDIVPEEERDIPNLESLISGWWDSCWLKFEKTICDQETINQIMNQNINMAFYVNNTCVDFQILLDRVKLNKRCETVNNVETFISEPPKFEVTKIIDNKKSWVALDTKDERFYDLKYRPAEYDVNHHKLVINTKEVDLNLSPARAVEQDIWCYMNDNYNILNCVTGNTYSCPSGTTMTPGLDNCYTYDVTGATFIGTTYSATTGNVNSAYGSSGTLFYRNGLNGILPYNLQGTSSTLKDGVGITIQPDQVVNTGTLWKNTSPSTSNGRLNNVGIWTTLPDSGGNAQPVQEWFGFAECIDIISEGTYSIGLASDNRTRFRIDGTEIYTSENLTGNSNKDLVYWRVFEIELTSGKHIIEMEGYNYDSEASFGAEIYQAPISQLTGMTSESELNAVTIFTTADLRTGTSLIPLGETNGFSCPTGYALDTCDGTGTYTCIKLNYSGITIDTECVCCPGQPLLVSPVATDGTISLPSTYKYNEDDYSDKEWYALKKNTCNNFEEVTYTIAEEIQSNGETYRFQEYETVNGCGPIYGMQGSTSVTQDINGYIIALENDGTIGVYEWEKLTGETATYENISNIICCDEVEDMFRIMESVLHQGASVYPTVSTDPNTGLCVYSRCGDRCSDLSGKVTTDLTEIDSVEEFRNVISSELIDVKNRQTIRAYPTLKMLYERYRYNALDFSSYQSSQYDYFDMDRFGLNVNNYWVDLIEQVVPATTIWESTYEYRNTVFDTQKYKYRHNNIYWGKDPSNDFPFNAVSTDNSVSVILETLPNITGGTEVFDCDRETREVTGVWEMQHTCSPEFLGKINIINNNSDSGLYY
jgi:hypothetical protein